MDCWCDPYMMAYGDDEDPDEDEREELRPWLVAQFSAWHETDDALQAWTDRMWQRAFGDRKAP
jgi:hypothetical protein